MPGSRLTLPVLVLALVGWVTEGPIGPARTLASAQDPEITIAVRPTTIRAGQTALVTVTVRAREAPPQAIDLAPDSTLEILSYADGYSTAVGDGGARELVLERRFEVQATAPGTLALRPWVVRMDGTDAPAPTATLTVGDPGLAWRAPPDRPRRRSNRRDDVLAEGVPPASSPDTREVMPGGITHPVYPVGPRYALPYPGMAYPGTGSPGVGSPGAYPGASMPYGAAIPYPGGPMWQGGPTPPYPGMAGPYPPYAGSAANAPSPGVSTPRGGRSSPVPGQTGWSQGGQSAYAPSGGEWAGSAESDPWWPEMVPELPRFTDIVEDVSGMVRLGTGLTPLSVFVGQQITHVATSYYLAGWDRVLWRARYLPPDAPGLWAVDLPEVTTAPAALRGEVSESVTFRRAFFGREPGVYEVGPARLTFDELGAGPGPYGRSDTLYSAPDAVEVMPIPARAAPPDWTGAVGRISVQAFLDPNVVVEGQPSVLTVRVSGVGNVVDFPPPLLDSIYGSDVRPGGEWALPEVHDGVLGGVKTFRFWVIPWQAGAIPVGPILYSYFDPYVGDFGRVATAELVLEVMPYEYREP